MYIIELGNKVFGNNPKSKTMKKGAKRLSFEILLLIITTPEKNKKTKFDTKKNTAKPRLSKENSKFSTKKTLVRKYRKKITATAILFIGLVFSKKLASMYSFYIFAA